MDVIEKYPVEVCKKKEKKKKEVMQADFLGSSYANWTEATFHSPDVDDRYGLLYSQTTLVIAGHQRTVSINTGCNQWLSLAKTLLKVGSA